MKISIVIPFYKMPNYEFFLMRCLNSVFEQTFTDYEIVLVNKGKWAENHNAGIKQAQGEYIKFLHMDDYFYDKYTLSRLAKFEGNWMITGCSNNLSPRWTEDIVKGNNKLGGPSCLMIRNHNPLLFDKKLSWMVDCDYYQRLFKRYGEPEIWYGNFIEIGEHAGQATHLIKDEVKMQELKYMEEKYA